MPPIDQIATRNALRDLKANPLLFLGATKVTAGGLPGVDTASGRLCLSMAANHLRIGSRGFVTMGGGPPDSVLVRQMLYTPMRSNTMAGRAGVTQRFQPGGNELWVTTRQTGCSVLILDWGGLGHAMVHLQPHAAGQFNRVARYVFTQSRSIMASTKNYYLRQEVTAVANATGGGVAPLRYILVQSAYTNALGHLQVIGVRGGPGWDFYSQLDQGGVFAAQALPWQVWSNWSSYVAVHS